MQKIFSKLLPSDWETDATMIIQIAEDLGALAAVMLTVAAIIHAGATFYWMAS